MNRTELIQKYVRELEELKSRYSEWAKYDETFEQYFLRNYIGDDLTIYMELKAKIGTAKEFIEMDLEVFQFMKTAHDTELTIESELKDCETALQEINDNKIIIDNDVNTISKAYKQGKKYALQEERNEKKYY